MEGCGEEPRKFLGRARGRRPLNACGPTTIPARDPREAAPGFSKLRSKVKLGFSGASGCASNDMTRPKSQVVPEDLCNVTEMFSTMGIDHTKVATSAQHHHLESLPTTVWTKPKEMVNKKGTTGQLVHINANYFCLLTVTNWQLYQYRVSFAPSEDSKVAKHKMVRDHKEKLGGYLFDGTMLFASYVYDEDPMLLTSARPSDGATVSITIRKAGVLAFGDRQYMHVFNILMRHCLQNLKLQQVGRYYYDPVERISIDRHKLELWPGYVTSIRQHEDKLLLCVELTHKVMRQDTVHDLLQECYRSNPDDYQHVFKKKILGSIVLTDYNNKTYRVDDVDFSATPQSQFLWHRNDVSFLHYFYQKYQLTIRDESQPMLVSRPKKNDCCTGNDNLIYLVPELCRMTGLTDSMRTNFRLMQDLATCTRLSPSERMERLQKFNRRLKTDSEISSELESWNMSMTEKLVSFSGRILPREMITLGMKGGQGNGKYDAGPLNDWTKRMSMNPMLTLQEVNSWAVVFPSNMNRCVQQFVLALQMAAANMELRLPKPYDRKLYDDHIATYVEGLENAVLTCNPQLILVVIPNNRLDRYSAIKKKCCVDLAVPTQVILYKNITRDNVKSVATKVAVQINCKLGGAPWTVDIPMTSLMVVGFDVYLDNKKGLSIGALVASLNGNMSRYFSAVRYHCTGEELSEELSCSLCKALSKFMEHNQGQLPRRIVIYRDGVGDGQIATVYQYEVALIRKQLAKIYGNTPFRMAFIIVTKHINTRLFLDGRNPPPGTVVDDVITLPERYDFYLVSQSVRQGTVTPTLYNVISDNVELDPDKIQRLTYKLTHLYFNWSGTIRVPAPVQYAHKLAYLVGQAIHKIPSANLDELLYYL